MKCKWKKISKHIYIYTYIHISGQEPSKASSSAYKTFHLVRDSDFFRPKLLADSTNNETESVDQISALYMRGMFLTSSLLFDLLLILLAWQLDQCFMDIFKKILPLQEQLHTLK